MYWKSFNVKPKGEISARAIKNDFEGVWAERHDSLSEIRLIVEQWSKAKYIWWKIRDNRLVDRVYTPRTSSRDEWAGAFKELSKLVVESFDAKGIREELDRRGIGWEESDKSLVLIERFMSEKLNGIRLIQRIRSTVDAHVGGAEAESMSSNALKQHESYAAHFEHVCRDAVEEMKRIEQVFQRPAGGVSST